MTRMIASVEPGFGSGLSVAVNPGPADVLTSARMGTLYTTASVTPTLSGGCARICEIGRMRPIRMLKMSASCLVHVVCLVYLVRLVDKIDEIDRTDQIDRACLGCADQ